MKEKIYAQQWYEIKVMIDMARHCLNVLHGVPAGAPIIDRYCKIAMQLDALSADCHDRFEFAETDFSKESLSGKKYEKWDCLTYALNQVKENRAFWVAVESVAEIKDEETA